eukprot:1854424-Prorocentrum_lima.AAC.1
MSTANVLGAQPSNLGQCVDDIAASRLSVERRRQWILDVSREHDFQRMMSIGKMMRNRRNPAA